MFVVFLVVTAMVVGLVALVFVAAVVVVVVTGSQPRGTWHNITQKVKSTPTPEISFKNPCLYPTHFV